MIIVRTVAAFLTLAAFNDQGAPPAPPPDRGFEVVSIKINRDGTGRSVLAQRGPGTFFAQNSTARNLVRGAYGVQGFRVVGGPNWIDDERFDITAKLEVAVSTVATSGRASKQRSCIS